MKPWKRLLLWPLLFALMFFLTLFIALVAERTPEGVYK